MKDGPSSDFNLVLTNLFIGLVRGHRFLRPASQQVKALGYRLFGVELSFVGTGGRVTPEAIACSPQTGHTLLTEWTERDAPDPQKQQQITRYLQVARSHLVDSAAVPPSAAGANSTWLVVQPDAVDAFWGCVKAEHQGKLLVSHFGVDSKDGPCVQYAIGELADPALASILKAGVPAKRVPRGYVRVSTDNLRSREFVEAVIQEIASLVVKQRQEFSGEDVASGMFDVWGSFGVKKREAVTRATNDLLKQLAQKRYCGAWLQRVQDSPPRWRVDLASEGGSPSMLRRLKATSARFVAEVMAGQQAMDFGAEAG